MKTTQIKAGLVALFSLTLVAGAVFIAPQAHAAVYADIQANGQDGPITIASGASVPLIWTSQGATDCDVQPINYHGTSGGGMTGALTSSQTYYLTCTGANGEVGSDLVTVNVGGGGGGSPITVQINANPATIYRGDTSTLTWSSTNATDCYASIGWSGGKPVNGSTPVNPQQTTTYRINCSNSSPASAHAETTVTVLDPINPPAGTGTIQGYKVHGASLTPIGQGTAVRLNGGSIRVDTNNPYGFSVAPGTYTVSADALSGFTLVGYTLCVNSTTCHNNTPTSGSATVTVTSGNSYDLWWHYSENVVTPPANGTIQGYKVNRISPTNLPPIGTGIAVRLNNGSAGTNMSNPYGFSIAPGNYTVSVDTISGYTLIGYTLCVNSTSCHVNTPTAGNSVSINVVSGNSYDLYWQYSENVIVPPTNNYPIGYFDSATCDAISGWARDIDSDPTPATSNVAVTVQLFNGPAQNGQLLAQLSANLPRESAVGNHGFSWTVPASLKDGTTRQIYAYALDVQDSSKSTLLTNSPKSLTCGGTNPVPPTVTINANPASITQGQNSTLTWSSANATTCTASGGWSGTKALSGSELVTPQVTTLYGITCFNNSGQSAYAQTIVTVNVVNNAPTVTLIANPTSITQGQSSVLTWASNNATTCIASAGWSGTKTLTGSEIVNPAITTTYFITCFNAIGVQANAQATVTVTGTPNNAPTVTLIANPPSIAQGQSSLLTWTSSNAVSCTATNGWSGGKALAGTETVYPSVTTTYTITCYNVSGQQATATTVVTVTTVNNAPTVSIYANPQSINQGQNSVLTWTSQNATTCSASSGWSGSKAVSGSESVQPGGTTTYTITCYNASGQQATAQTVVVVNTIGNNPTVTLTANPSSINQGQQSTLYWSSQNANTCYASGGNWNGNKNLSGSEVVSPYQTTSYTITCIGTNGQQVQAIATVFVGTIQNQQLPTVTLTANPSSVNPGQQSLLTWTSYNANTCYASGGNWSGQKGTSGNESVYPQITTTYTITCSNNYGSANDTEVVYTTGGGNGNAQVTKNVLNRTLNQTTFVNSIEGQGLDVLEFEIRVRNNDSQMRNIVVQDPLPQELFYVAGSTSVNGINTIDGIATSNGLVLNSMNPNEERTIRFRAVIFAGTTPRTITNQANASGFGSGTTYGSATIVVRNRGVVLGVANIPTGAGSSLIWSIFLGFFAALLFHMGADKAGWYNVAFSRTARVAVASTASTNVPVSDRPRRIEELLHAVRKRKGITEIKTKPSK